MNEADVRKEYQRRRDELKQPPWGWSFLYSPEATIRTARVALIGLNPKADGDTGAEQDSSWFYEGERDAYVDQYWSNDGMTYNPLQVQVQNLFAILNLEHGKVLCAQFVPFKSPRWRDVADKEGAVEFGRRLWESVLDQTSASLFICLGVQVVGPAIAQLLGQKSVKERRLDWGERLTWREYGCANGRTVVELPHLSTYKFFKPPGVPQTQVELTARLRQLADKAMDRGE